jgi:hypothetical protein
MVPRRRIRLKTDNKRDPPNPTLSMQTREDQASPRAEGEGPCTARDLFRESGFRPFEKRPLRILSARRYAAALYKDPHFDPPPLQGEGVNNCELIFGCHPERALRESKGPGSGILRSTSLLSE